MPSTMTAPKDHDPGRADPKAAAAAGRGAAITAGALVGVLTAWAWTTVDPTSWGTAGWLASVVAGSFAAAAVKNR